MPGKSGGHSLDRARALFERRGDPCAICGGALGPINYRGGKVLNPATGRLARDPLALDVDHIVPTCQGGTDELSNLQATHHVCNLKAGAKRSRRRSAKTHSVSIPRTSRKW